MSRWIAAAVMLAGFFVAAAGYLWGSRLESHGKNFHGDPVDDAAGFRRAGAMILLLAGLLLSLIGGPLLWVGAR
jgi:hypothetical protein